MPHVEANACGKPVLAIDAMAFRDTMVHGETAFLADVGEEITVTEGVAGTERIVFKEPRTEGYRASTESVARYLRILMQDAELRKRMGDAGRCRAVKLFDHRQVARQFLKIVSDRLGIQ
jgi:starch synthase